MNTSNNMWTCGLLLCLVCLLVGAPASAGLIWTSTEGAIGTYSASAWDLINLGSPSFSSQSNSNPAANFGSDPTGIGLNNGTIYSDGDAGATENGRTYCPIAGSSITFNLNTVAQPAGYSIGAISSISGGSQDRRSQRFRLEYSTVGSPAFTTLVDESQVHFSTNADNGEMRVVIRDTTGAPIATGVDQLRVTYFLPTGVTHPDSMYRELDVYAPSAARMVPPVVTSANLKAHFDAGDITGDGGLANPPSGTDLNTWSNVVTGQPLNNNSPIDGKPTFIAAGSGGISNQPTVRWEATGSGGDLMFNNAMSFQAQTIIAIATMKDNGDMLATMISDAHSALGIRQTDAASPAYYPGNSGDFIAGNGIFTINGTPTFTIPGGFDTPHVVKAVRDTSANYDGFRISDNIAANRRWNGDIAEILVFDSKLSANDTARVNKYIIDKYAINQVVDEVLRDSGQIANEPFVSGGSASLGVNFHYGNGATTGTINGIAFDNINLSGGNVPPSGPYALTANRLQATLTLNMPFTEDNGERTQNVAATGPDAATLNQVGGHMFYLSNNNTHPSAEMLFSGLQPNTDMFVQIIGGDDGWNGDIRVVANGTTVDWTTVADFSGNNASLLGFFAVTDPQGRLDLNFTVPAGNYAGIGGIILTENVPEPATALLLLAGLPAIAARIRRRLGRA